MGEKPKPNPIEIPLEKIVQKLWGQRSFRFLFVGVLLTLLNILLIVVLVDIFNLNTPLL
jgi:hypothetical protein